MSKPTITNTSAMRALPSVDELLRTEVAETLRCSVGAPRLTAILRAISQEMRAEIQAREAVNPLDNEFQTREALLAEAIRRLEDSFKRDSLAGLRRVVNATGVILHTNLGRAPLSDSARQAIGREASGYCTLEYDLITGSRGKRGARVEGLLVELTGAEDALVVNNCAAAALLILTVLASDGETIVSRGELVEIGGDFRVPEVMANSRTVMIEVGTTNRTSLDDYRRAIGRDSRLIMRVHPSNYRIVGFTSSPSLSVLASLAHEVGLVLYQDAGSGALIDLTAYGLGEDPVIRDCISDGADVVSFSGDKLLGSSQAGLIVGRREIIGRLRKHSLYRALRVDKISLAVLEATLDSYRRNGELEEVPALRMLALTRREIEERARRLIASLSESFKSSGIVATIMAGESAVGGGSGPNAHLPTALVALQHVNISAEEIQRRLRLSSPPVVARIAEERVLLDLRTVAPEEEPYLFKTLSSLNA